MGIWGQALEGQPMVSTIKGMKDELKCSEATDLGYKDTISNLLQTEQICS